MEKGWLTFACASGKRRLAPFPSEWESAPETELERLCATARAASPARFAPGSPTRPGTSPFANVSTTVVSASGVPRLDLGGTSSEGGTHTPVREAVRAFAHEAREGKLPAIEAMVRLKALLSDRYGRPDVASNVRAESADMSLVRRWFVEAFYFDRAAKRPPDAG